MFVCVCIRNGTSVESGGEQFGSGTWSRHRMTEGGSARRGRKELRIMNFELVPSCVRETMMGEGRERGRCCFVLCCSVVLCVVDGVIDGRCQSFIDGLMD